MVSRIPDFKVRKKRNENIQYFKQFRYKVVTDSKFVRDNGLRLFVLLLDISIHHGLAVRNIKPIFRECTTNSQEQHLKISIHACKTLWIFSYFRRDPKTFPEYSDNIPRTS